MPVTINGSGSIAGLSVGGLGSGVVNTATLANGAATGSKLSMPTGSVIQTVQGFSGTKTITNTTAHGDAPQCPASVTITPTSASNKILIMFHASWHFGNANDVGFWLLRNGTIIGNSTRTSENNICFATTSNDSGDGYKSNHISFNFLDDAQNTSAHTYTVRGMGIQGSKTPTNKALAKGANSNNEEMAWGGSITTSGNESSSGNSVIIAQEIKG
tara:strand:+ start:692 stop:1336 length:645 start_codon:yes stop_codon:yes gene_type:complete